MNFYYTGNEKEKARSGELGEEKGGGEIDQTYDTYTHTLYSEEGLT